MVKQQLDLWSKSSCTCGGTTAVLLAGGYVEQKQLYTAAVYVNTVKGALHVGKQQQYIVGKAASHVGKTAAVYMWEKQLYMWETEFEM